MIIFIIKGFIFTSLACIYDLKIIPKSVKQNCFENFYSKSFFYYHFLKGKVTNH